MFFTTVHFDVSCVQCPYEKNNKVMSYVQTLPVFSETSELTIHRNLFSTNALNIYVHQFSGVCVCVCVCVHVFLFCFHSFFCLSQGIKLKRNVEIKHVERKCAHLHLY